MSILDILRAPWAITPDKLAEMQAIYQVHLRGEKLDIGAIEARIGRPLQNNQKAAYDIQDGGVAVLALDGIIAPKMNFFMQISGGVSAQQFERAVLDAAVDPQVRSLLIATDSPGGSVNGTPEVAAAVQRFAAVKPVAALATGVMASAAYWIGSSANAVYASGPTVMVGSIGVVATHDYTPQKDGTQTTEITAGKYKRIASANEPLSKDGRAYLQSQVDHLYQVFVDTVAAHRGTSAEQVLKNMADGRVFIGQQAIDAGLVDGVSTLDALVAEMASHPDRFAQRRKAVFALGSPSKSAGAAPKDRTPVKGTASMNDDNPTLTRASLEQDHAAVFAQVRAEFMALGATQERTRIAGVREQAMPGHEALIEQLAADGKTTPEQAAMAVMAAHRQAMNAAAQAHANDAPAAAAHSPAPADTAPDPKAQAGDKAAKMVALFRKNQGVASHV